MPTVARAARPLFPRARRSEGALGSPTVLAATLVLLAALLAAPGLLATPAHAGDWISLGGNSEHNGQSADLGPSSANVLWQGTVSGLFGGPLFIEGNRLITMRFQSIAVTPIVCYDLYSGQQQWSVDFPGTNSRSVPRGVHDGRVYATNFQETQADTIIALDINTGARAWVSPVRAPLGIVWTACFAPNGDLVMPCAGDDIARLDATDGHAVWVASRSIPNTGAEAVCVHGNSVYGMEGFLSTPKMVTAWDLATGAKRYSSPALAGDGDQEMPATVAPDGTIYLKRDGGPLYALVDTGSALLIKWQKTINAGFFGGHIAVGLDGSVYIPDGTQLVRLDPASGTELNRSQALVSSSALNPRVVVAADGTLYVGNSGASDGMLYALSPALVTLWSTPVNGMTYGGPALGTTGALAVSGAGTLLKVFRTESAGVAGNELAVRLDLSGAPNPFRDETAIRFALPTAGEASLVVYDAAGRAVRTLLAGEARPAGEQSIWWDGRDASGRDAGSGIYFLRLVAGNRVTAGKVQRVR